MERLRHRWRRAVLLIFGFQLHKRKVKMAKPKKNRPTITHTRFSQSKNGLEGAG